jgi:hypothetical protein
MRDTLLKGKYKYLEEGVFVIAVNLDLWAFALDKLVADVEKYGCKLSRIKQYKSKQIKRKGNRRMRMGCVRCCQVPQSRLHQPGNYNRGTAKHIKNEKIITYTPDTNVHDHIA